MNGIEEQTTLADTNSEQDNAPAGSDNRQNIKSFPGTTEIDHPWGSGIYTLKDAFQPRPQTKEVVPGLIACPSLNILYGSPSTLKSMQLMDLGMCVAAGKQWLEPLDGNQCRTFQTNQSGVFWIDFDNGNQLTHQRVQAIAKGHNVSENIPFLYTSMPKPWLDSSDGNQMEKLGMLMDNYETKLVIVDNLGVVLGGTEENSIGMASVMSNWRKMAEDFNLAIIIIHHQTKNNSTGRAGNSLRGHSSIEASVDLALMVERDEQSPMVTLQSTKARSADVQPFSAKFEYHSISGTSELADARFYGVSASADLKSMCAEKAIIDTVTKFPGINKGDLTSKVHQELGDFGKTRIGALIEKVVDANKLHAKTKENNAKVYYPATSESKDDNELLPKAA